MAETDAFQTTLSRGGGIRGLAAAGDDCCETGNRPKSDLVIIFDQSSSYLKNRSVRRFVMSRLTGKVAIVTGASKGIGAAIARGLAAEGASVTVNYSGGKEGAERVVAEIVRAGGKAIPIQANVSNATDVRRMFAETKTAFGAVDVLVNNAGVFKWDPVEAITAEEFHREFDTNVLGTILTTQEAIKHFPSTGGSIINLSSISSENPVPNSSLYSATKAAIDTITVALSRELGPRKIRVNAVAPGETDTDGNRASGFVGSAAGVSAASATPLGGRIGLPEDIAPVVVFLASDEASWLTGERISASGGLR
jgi:3-oxoacyl-[acyl-carrier protein] reductase